MKKSLRLIACSLLMMAGSGSIHAQGWPADYPGVMLQAFYWDSYSQSAWTKLTAQSDALARTFNLVWIPQSGYCGGTSMGYDDLYWFNNYNSSFGNEQELRTLISTFKEKGIGTIADVVINHRKNVSNWVDFPRETYKGETYEMVSTDIVLTTMAAKPRSGLTKTASVSAPIKTLAKGGAVCAISTITARTCSAVSKPISTSCSTI